MAIAVSQTLLFGDPAWAASIAGSLRAPFSRNLADLTLSSFQNQALQERLTSYFTGNNQTTVVTFQREKSLAATHGFELSVNGIAGLTAFPWRFLRQSKLILLGGMSALTAMAQKIHDVLPGEYLTKIAQKEGVAFSHLL